MSLKWLTVIGLVIVPVLAQAECVWLLMAPPITDPKAPISVWYQAGAYYSAEACERGKAAFIDGWRKIPPIESDRSPGIPKMIWLRDPRSPRGGWGWTRQSSRRPSLPRWSAPAGEASSAPLRVDEVIR
jgi:hypothetical protein